MRSRFFPEPGSHCVVQAGLSLVIVLLSRPIEGIKLRKMGPEGRTWCFKRLSEGTGREWAQGEVGSPKVKFTEDTVRC